MSELLTDDMKEDAMTAITEALWRSESNDGNSAARLEMAEGLFDRLVEILGMRQGIMPVDHAALVNAFCAGFSASRTPPPGSGFVCGKLMAASNGKGNPRTMAAEIERARKSGLLPGD